MWRAYYSSFMNFGEHQDNFACQSKVWTRQEPRERLHFHPTTSEAHSIFRKTIPITGEVRGRRLSGWEKLQIRKEGCVWELRYATLFISSSPDKWGGQDPFAWLLAFLFLPHCIARALLFDKAYHEFIDFKSLSLFKPVTLLELQYIFKKDFQA